MSEQELRELDAWIAEHVMGWMWWRFNAPSAAINSKTKHDKWCQLVPRAKHYSSPFAFSPRNFLANNFVNTTPFESTPRWPGAPKVCVAANLPAFATRKEMKSFQDALCGSALMAWECDACGCLHYEPKYPAPAGSSSGNERRPANDLERAEVLDWMKQVKLKIKTEKMNKPHTTLCPTATFATG